MRMWMVPVKYLCNKYLIAEAAEIHLFINNILSGKSVTGYIENNYLEPSSLCKRHNELVEEMKRRGYTGHTTDLDCSKVDELIRSKLTPTEYNKKINKKKAMEDLKKRCIRDPITGKETKPK
ncbi:MAG: pyrimidine dimer DNA glycosylase/endonuclease V [Candidatus Micrarchaeaceae archaeon]